MISQKVLDWIKREGKGVKAPVYVYDTEKVKQLCADFTGIQYPNTDIYFATMANCNHDFLSVLKQQGIMVFVNSLMHLNAVKKLGYKEKDIIFTASSISKEMMHTIYNEKIYVNLDSITQLEYYTSTFPDSKVGIRCNIENDTYKAIKTRAGEFIGENSRLGLNIEEINGIKNKDRINGLHIYVGTDIVDIDYFISYYQSLINLVDSFPNIEYLDFGGGFGVEKEDDDAFDFDVYSKALTDLMTSVSTKLGKNIKLILEPGRKIAAQSAYFICRVTDIKLRNNIQYIGVNASSTQFPRPLLYPSEAVHPVFLLDKNGDVRNGVKINSKVSGCSTYSKDYLAHKALLASAEIDDIIVFANAGAYCSSMHTSFLGFEIPKEIFI